jgi:hypothetical protein
MRRHVIQNPSRDGQTGANSQNTKEPPFQQKHPLLQRTQLLRALDFFLEYMYNIIDVFIIIQDSTWLGSLPCAFELPVFQAWCDILGTVSQLAAGWKRSAVHPA